MENGQRTISELFAASTFSVPVYQRAYAWDERQCEDFLNDLVEHPSGDQSKRHFLGTVLLAEKSPEGRRTQFDVVDGQQRLTTATIFAIVAIARMEEDENLLTQAAKFRHSLVFGSEGERLFHTVQDDEGFLTTLFTATTKMAPIIFPQVLKVAFGRQSPSLRKILTRKSRRTSIGC